MANGVKKHGISSELAQKMVEEAGGESQRTWRYRERSDFSMTAAISRPLTG